MLEIVKSSIVLIYHFFKTYGRIDIRIKGVISPFLNFFARIKATNSALKNHDKKALDDVFGIEFICATDREIQIVQQELERLIYVGKIKMHDKNNGYKAVHHSCSIKESIINEINNNSKKECGVREGKEKFPVVEIQYKTIQVYYEAVYGTASHEKYKDTQLPKLQEFYDEGKLQVGKDIPHMWASNPLDANAKKMSMEEVLKKMYPSLALKSERTEMLEK